MQEGANKGSNSKWRGADKWEQEQVTWSVRNSKRIQEGADKGSNSRWSGADKREQEQEERIT